MNAGCSSNRAAASIKPVTGDDPRLPTHLWVEAEIRRLIAQGFAVYVAAKGDMTGGLVIQKISDLRGKCRLLGQQRDIDGRLKWLDILRDGPIDEKDADAYIARAIERDPDLWVVEIEDRAMDARLSGY